MAKKIYTREEFELLRLECAQNMSKDKELKNEAQEVLVKADQYNWIHQTNWFGEPILNIPQDMFALQEIIFKTRPKYIIEIGVAWGGSLLFYSTLMEVIGGEKVIGVDIFIPDDLKKRICSHGKISDKIELITGSSLDDLTVKKIKSIIGECNELLIILDSYHTHDHVLSELKLYAPIIGKGFYIVCSDTIIEFIPEQMHRKREWGHGNNPYTAVLEFLKGNNSFKVDDYFDNKLLLSCNYKGYIKRIKD